MGCCVSKEASRYEDHGAIITEHDLDSTPTLRRQREKDFGSDYGSMDSNDTIVSGAEEFNKSASVYSGELPGQYENNETGENQLNNYATAAVTAAEAAVKRGENPLFKPNDNVEDDIKVARRICKKCRGLLLNAEQQIDAIIGQHRTENADPNNKQNQKFVL